MIDDVPDGATARIVDTGDIRLRILEQGSGPAVVLCHGFPGLAYSWRHQLRALAEHGYRAIAPDMRGYGGSEAPSNPRAYGRERTVGDLTGLLDALRLDTAVFSGHDFGTTLVWDLPQWAPGRVRGLIQLSVPRRAPGPERPSAGYRQTARNHFLHMHYFQQPGVADRELAAAPEEFLRRVFWALSGGGQYLDVFAHPSEGNGYLDVLPPAPPLPWPWLTQPEFDVYARTFARTGFTGGLNWYRAADEIWLEKQDRPDEPVTVPSVYITGARDPVTVMLGRRAVEDMRELVPGLTGVHVLPDAGHFVQMEAADEVNRLMLDFLGALD